MAANTDVIADDLGVISERLQPFAPHEETRRKLRELHDEYQDKLARMEDLFEGRRLSCPIHQDTENVIITGNGRNGTKQFNCRKHHDPEETDRETTEFRFSTFTSHEAYAVYQDFLVEALTLLTTCEGTYAGIAEYLNLSKHMVEYGTATLVDFLDDQSISRDSFDIDEDEDLIVVYADFSSTRVSNSLSLIMGRVDDEICYYTCPSMNWLTAWNFVKAIDVRLGETDATVVFVTDGEVSLIEPIRSCFPEAIHIRQFHSANSRGIIYTHLPVDDQCYTVRCRWDAVLAAGTPSENAQQMRRWRQSNENEAAQPNERSGSDGWTDLSDDIFVWEGIAKYPRGTRRKPEASSEGDSSSTSDSTSGSDDEAESEADAEVEATNDTGEGATEAEVIAPSEGPTEVEATEPDDEEATPNQAGDSSSDRGNQDDPGDEPGEDAVTSGTDGVDRIFRRSIEEARGHPIADQVLDVLEKVFGGHFITSNVAEALFHLKPALTAHRTVKRGDDFIRLFLFLRTQVNGMARAEMRSFFRDEVVTVDRLRSVAVHRTRTAETDLDPEEVVLEAHREGEPVVIRYKDRYGKKTSRMIDPLDIENDQYTGATRIDSYCYLREAERTFLSERIIEAIPVDTDLSVVSAEGL